MKLIWNKTLQNKDFAGFHGEGFVFQAQPETSESPEIIIPSNPNTNQEVNELTQNTSHSVSNAIGSWTTNRTSDVDFGSTNPGRVDGMLPSQNNRRLWNIPRQFWITFFPDRILRNRIVSSLGNLNIANNGANGIYTNIQNELHQRSLEQTVSYIMNSGSSLEHASLADMDLAENIAKSLDAHQKEKIKSGVKQGNKILNTRRPFTKFAENILPTNWLRKRQFNWMNRNNNARNQQTNKSFMAKAVTARENLEGEVNTIETSINTQKKGWINRNENDNKQAWHAFVQEVVANPNGFLTGAIPLAYNFAEICGSNNRVRVLDAILLRGFADEAIEAENATQAGRDMTANLANLNTREISSEADIMDLEDDPVERLYDLLPDPDTGETPTELPNDAELVGDLIWEIIRVERRHDVDFDINNAVFGGQANKMNATEKVSYLINYMILPANINRFVKNPGLATPNFAGLDDTKAKKLKLWLLQFRDETTETGVGLESTEWATLQTNAAHIITSATAALTACGSTAFSDSFLSANHGTIPAQLAPINSFIHSFNLFDFETTINKIDDAHKGVFADFQKQMTVIKNTLTDMVSEIKTAHAAENLRMTTPIGTPPLLPTARIDLAVGIPLSLPDPAITALLTSLTTRIAAHDHPGVIGGTGVNYDKLRVHLSSESKKSRETQFREDLNTNTAINWNFWRNHDTVGRVIPLLQGDRINYATDSTHTISGAFAANDLLVIENRQNTETGKTQIIAQDPGGTELYIIEEDNSKLIAHRFDVPVAQHGANTPKTVPSINNATEKIEVYNMAA